MKNLMMLFALALAMVLVGCVSAPVPPADSRVTIAPNLGNKLMVTDVRCANGGSHYLTFQANVVNNTGSELRVQWKVQWLDADGMEIESLVSSWGALAIQPYEIKALKGTAPRTDAVDMRFYVREMD